MEKLISVLVLIACLMVSVANYPDAVNGAKELYYDLFGEK